ncbi:hypothetical protein BKA70DRAFT_834002 [Coprinopsis sp. MPI-PUGE-AT-0042]|nr:hypothetical protein BKA70DRAFT_834002 [Coprinopsis sp. MPI-PUGE-AT-0042]
MSANFPLPQPEDASVATGPSHTPRLKTSLRCLYALLALGVPIFILQMTPWCEPFDTLWLFPIGLLFNMSFAASATIVTLQGFAYTQHHKSPTSQLPALFKLGAIIPCFLLVVYWASIVAVVTLVKITLVTADSYNYYFGHYRYQGNELANSEPISYALLGVQGVLFAGQAGLLLAVGILGSQERKDIKRQLSAAT